MTNTDTLERVLKPFRELIGPLEPLQPVALREADAALRYGVSQTFLKREIRARRLAPPTRITRGLKVYLVEDLDAWFERRKANPAESTGFRGPTP
ncbi:MAG: hypothetical protein AAF851_20280 [Myxococcota bacterium]